jgi:citrate synthase
MSKLQEKLAQQVPGLRETVKKLTKESGSVKISDVTVEQAYGGMRGVKSLVCDTSEVPPDKGLIIRGIPVAQLTEQLPEETFWLLLTARNPTPTNWRTFEPTSAPARRYPTTSGRSSRRCRPIRIRW